MKKTTLVQYKTNDVGFKIKTPTGMQFFDGVAKLKNESDMLTFILENGKDICVTDNHRFSIDDVTIFASDIKVGTELQVEDGYSKVKKIEKTKKEEYVYDVINVRNGNIYYTNGIVSHNCQFLGSSITLIDSQVLERTTVIQPVDYKYSNAMLIYEQPQDGAMYILGVDSAKGNGSDFSTIQILKISGEHDIDQVAIYRNNMIAPHEFVQVCIGISEYYNYANMMVESNDIGELVTSILWNDYECEQLLNCDHKGLGIRSTRKTKLAGNLLLKRYLENGWLEIHDARTLYELSRYEEVSPNVFHAAGQNEHDDTVTSLIWGLYFLVTTYYDGTTNTANNKKIEDKYSLNGEGPTVVSENDYDEGWELI